MEHLPTLVLKLKPFLAQLAKIQAYFGIMNKRLPILQVSSSMTKVPDKIEQLHPANLLRVSLLEEPTNIYSTLNKLKSSLQYLHTTAYALNLFLPMR